MKNKLFATAVVGAGVLVGAIAINRAVPASPTGSTQAVESVLAAISPAVGVALFIVGGMATLTMLKGATAP